ncbi:helix-turn-helix transcriptional regulator [bacterium]|nr:helix-turn-helix transcriptional regulator [bacterium]
MQDNSDKNKSYMNEFSKIMKIHRKTANKSMYLVSAESGISKSSWREIEKGMREDINLSTFCKIAEGLDIPCHELLKELMEKLGEDFSFTGLKN